MSRRLGDQLFGPQVEIAPGRAKLPADDVKLCSRLTNFSDPRRYVYSQTSRAPPTGICRQLSLALLRVCMLHCVRFTSPHRAESLLRRLYQALDRRNELA